MPLALEGSREVHDLDRVALQQGLDDRGLPAVDDLQRRGTRGLGVAGVDGLHEALVLRRVEHEAGVEAEHEAHQAGEVDIDVISLGLRYNFD